MSKLTIVGGGLSGLVAAITAAARGTVDLLRSQSGRRGAAPAHQAFAGR